MPNSAFRHDHRNPHHPEHLKPGKGVAQRTPQRYLLEMRCGGQAFAPHGPDAPRRWYAVDRDRFGLHPDTREASWHLLGTANR